MLLARSQCPRLAVLAALAAAACQPLPHPFALDIPPPGSALMSVPDSVSLSVAPVRGEPQATAESLAEAMAEALRKREVPASARAASVESDELDGSIEAARTHRGKLTLIARWRLRDAKGRFLGERWALAKAPAKAWRSGDKAAVAALAAASADEVAALLLGKAPATAPGPHRGRGSALLASRHKALGHEAASAGPPTPRGSSPPPPVAGPTSKPAEAGRVRLLVRAVEGAPGDGGAALGKAMRFFLGQQKLVLVTGKGGRPDFVLAGNVAVAKTESGKEHVKIVWRVLRPNGKEVGTVVQQNDVPAGLLDRSWGDLAYIVANAAKGGILELLARGRAAPAKG